MYSRHWRRGKHGKQRNKNELHQNDNGWAETHAENKQIRWNIIYPPPNQEYMAKGCNIYRWYATKASTYLNNRMESDADLIYVTTISQRIQKIRLSKDRNKIQNQTENSNWDNCIAYINTEQKTGTENVIRKLKLPIIPREMAYIHYKTSPM